MSTTRAHRRISKLNRQSHAALGAIVAGSGALVGAAAEAEVIIINDGFTVTGSFKGGVNTKDFFAKGAKFEVSASTNIGKIKVFARAFSKNGIFKDQSLEEFGEFVQVFAAGSKVGGPGSGPTTNEAAFYDAFARGDQPFDEVDETGFIGFVVEVPELLQVAAVAGEDIDAIEEGPLPGLYYGWAEVTRGSLIVSRIGIQTLPNTPALVPGGGPIDVPEPATLPLMALGAAGLAALRRRKAA